MTATLTTTVNAVESAIGKLKLNGAANGHANGHINGNAHGHVNGGVKKSEARLVDPFNYVVSLNDPWQRTKLTAREKPLVRSTKATLTPIFSVSHVHR